MSRPQSHRLNRLNLDMHGLVFETSIWLLAGSTRYLMRSPAGSQGGEAEAAAAEVHFAAPEGARVVETWNREVG